MGQKRSARFAFEPSRAQMCRERLVAMVRTCRCSSLDVPSLACERAPHSARVPRTCSGPRGSTPRLDQKRHWLADCCREVGRQRANLGPFGAPHLAETARRGQRGLEATTRGEAQCCAKFRPAFADSVPVSPRSARGAGVQPERESTVTEHHARARDASQSPKLGGSHERPEGQERGRRSGEGMPRARLRGVVAPGGVAWRSAAPGGKQSGTGCLAEERFPSEAGARRIAGRMSKVCASNLPSHALPGPCEWSARPPLPRTGSGLEAVARVARKRFLQGSSGAARAAGARLSPCLAGARRARAARPRCRIVCVFLAGIFSAQDGPPTRRAPSRPWLPAF